MKNTCHYCYKYNTKIDKEQINKLLTIFDLPSKKRESTEKDS